VASIPPSAEPLLPELLDPVVDVVELTLVVVALLDLDERAAELELADG
jgi:hypothetical protein